MNSLLFLIVMKHSACSMKQLCFVNTKIPVQIQYKKNNSSAIVNAFVNIALAEKHEIQQSMTS